MRFQEFSIPLLEGFKEALVDFTDNASEDEVKDYLERFREVVKRNKASGDERNIDYWRKQGWDQFRQFVNTAEQSLSSREAKGKRKRVGKSITLKETSKWLIVIPLDKEASCFHGSGTDWCTTKPAAPWFERYFYKDSVTLIYVISKASGGKWAIAYHDDVEPMEFFDQDDRSITIEEFKSQTQLDPSGIVRLIEPHHQDDIEQSRVDWNDLKGRVEFMLDDKKVGGDVERGLLKLKDLEYMGEYMAYADEGGSEQFRSAVLKTIGSTLRVERVSHTNIMEMLEKAFRNHDIPESFVDHVIQLLRESLHRQDLTETNRTMDVKWIIGGIGRNPIRPRMAKMLMDVVIEYDLEKASREVLRFLPRGAIDQYIEWIVENRWFDIQAVKPQFATVKTIQLLTDPDNLEIVGDSGKYAVAGWIEQALKHAKEVKTSIGDIMTRAREKLDQDEITRGQYDDVMDAIKGLAGQKGYSQPDNLLAIAEEYDISDDTDVRELTNRLLNIES